MVDRTPQQFPNGEPDGITDNTAAIQAAIDAWQPGDQVVLSGGTFRTSGVVNIAADHLVLRGDGKLRARSGFAGTVMLHVSGQGIVIDGDGLEFDQAEVIVSGSSIVASHAVGLEIRNLLSRNTQRAFVQIDTETTDLLVQDCDHAGKAYGVVSFDAPGLARITLRGNRFVHPGTGTAGDAVQLNCPTYGAADVSIIDCTAVGYIGEASDQGMGFGFAHVTDGRLIGCTVRSCAGDGFHLEHLSHRWLCRDLRVENVGVSAPLGGNGSGFIAYDSDDITVILSVFRDCGFHGIALSGQGQALVASDLRTGGLIERCVVDTTRRDGIHVTAQSNFRIDRNLVRDPSLGNPGLYAGIHVGQQGGTTLENSDGTGLNNTVVLSGATAPLAPIVVRPTSIDVAIDGIMSDPVEGFPFDDGQYFTDGTGWVDAA